MKNEMTGSIKAIYDILPHGCTHPITANTIRDRLGIPKRNIYESINTLIMLYDVPIGGLRSDNHHGYFIITNEGERHMAIDPLEHHASEIMARVAKIRSLDLKDTDKGDEKHDTK